MALGKYANGDAPKSVCALKKLSPICMSDFPPVPPWMCRISVLGSNHMPELVFPVNVKAGCVNVDGTAIGIVLVAYADVTPNDALVPDLRLAVVPS